MPIGGLEGHPVSLPGAASCCIAAIAYAVGRGRSKVTRQLEEVHAVEGAEGLGRTFLLALPQPVAFRGQVNVERANALVSEAGDLGVILEDKAYLMTNKQDQNNGEWQPSNKMTSSHTAEADSWWISGQGGDKVFPINGKSAGGVPMSHAWHLYEPSDHNPIQAMVDQLKGEHVIGEKRVQTMLPVGETVTAVGELARGQGGRLELRRPPTSRAPFFITRKTLPELVRSKREDAIKCQVVCVGAAGVGVALFLHKVWRRRRERVHREKLRAAMAEAREAAMARAREAGGEGVAAAGGAGGGDGDQGRDVCVVCLDREYDAVFVGCGHLCMCYACAKKVPRGCCPICRKKSAVLRIYKS